MIVIDLSCSAGHTFEAWFPSSAAFEQQHAAGQVMCPHCGNTDIRRVPSAAYIPKHGSVAGHRVKTPVKDAVPPKGEAAPVQGVTALKALIDTVLKDSEDVGQNFATEVRRIHYQEAPARSVHGQASLADFKSLVEEGIDVLPIPKIQREDLN